MVNLKSEISKRVSQLIDQSGLTAKDHSERSGIDKSALSNWMSEKNAPDALALCSLADYFNVSTDYILGRHDGKTQNLEAIRQSLGLTAPAVRSLRLFNKGDRVLGIRERAGKSEALSAALASPEFLELVSSIMLLKSGTEGHFSGMLPVVEPVKDAEGKTTYRQGEYYEGRLSPDTYAAALAHRLFLTLERLRKGEGSELPAYGPFARDEAEEKERLTLSGEWDQLVRLKANKQRATEKHLKEMAELDKEIERIERERADGTHQ